MHHGILFDRRLIHTILVRNQSVLFGLVLLQCELLNIGFLSQSLYVTTVTTIYNVGSGEKSEVGSQKSEVGISRKSELVESRKMTLLSFCLDPSMY